MMNVRRIHQLPNIDRPREKLQLKGAAALSNFELIEAIIGGGNGSQDVGTIARQVQGLLRKGISALTYESLINVKGINEATAAKILASVELTKRLLVWESEPLIAMSDILARVADIRGKQQEYLLALTLDGGQRLIALRTITVGTLDMVIAHPREVYADAIADRAASLIVVHNHPSGDVTPSSKDVTLTQQLAAAGQLLGITLRDHIIVGKTDYFSFRQHHLL